jgi:arginyl-tRNA synthetase
VENEDICSINQDGKDLIFQALLLPDILEEAFAKRDMQKVTDYLHFLSAMVHKFYNEHRIIGESNEKQYLKALSMVALSLRVGLKVLGIVAKEVM